MKKITGIKDPVIPKKGAIISIFCYTTNNTNAIMNETSDKLTSRLVNDIIEMSVRTADNAVRIKSFTILDLLA